MHNSVPLCIHVYLRMNACMTGVRLDAWKDGLVSVRVCFFPSVLWILPKLTVTRHGGDGQAGKHDDHNHDDHQCRSAALPCGLRVSWPTVSSALHCTWTRASAAIILAERRCSGFPVEYVTSQFAAIISGNVVAMTKLPEPITPAPHAVTRASIARRR